MFDKKLLYYVIKESASPDARYFRISNTMCWVNYRNYAHKPYSIHSAALELAKLSVGAIIVAVEQSEDGPKVGRVLDDREACPEGAELKWALREDSGMFRQGFSWSDIVADATTHPDPRLNTDLSCRWVRIAITKQPGTITERIVR